jgi:hypothetical protein
MIATRCAHTRQLKALEPPIALKYAICNGKLGVRWQRVSLPCTVPRNEALVQGKFTRRHRLSSGAVVNGKRIRTSTTRNLDEAAVVTLGLCKSGVAGLVILALCRRTPN